MSQENKDFIRLGALLVVTEAFWISTVANADAAQRYSTEDSCYYGADPEQAMRQMPECLRAIQFNLDTMVMEVQHLIKQTRKARQEYNNQICGKQ